MLNHAKYGMLSPVGMMNILATLFAMLQGVSSLILGGICTSDAGCGLVEHSHCSSDGKCVCDFGYKESDAVLGGCVLFLERNILIGIGVGAAVLLIIAIIVCVCCCKRR